MSSGLTFQLAALVAQDDAPESIENALGVAQTVIEYSGTVAFAVSAALLAGRRRMNVVGVVVFAVIVAVGGGTIRDILVGELPVYWVTEPAPLAVAAAAAALTILSFRTAAFTLVQRFDLVHIFDAAGLALFTVLGTNIALDLGAGAVSAVVIGVISGVGGGIIRDTLAERIPVALSSGHLYASAAITGSVLNIALLETDLPDSIASVIAVAYIFVVRILSIHFDWGAPTFAVRRKERRANPSPSQE